MSSIVIAMRRPGTLMLVALVSGGVLGLAKRPPDAVPPRKIVVTSPRAMDAIVTHKYICQIHAQRYINVCALQNGYLEQISVKRGQAVKQGDSMFKFKATADLNFTNIRAPIDGIVDGQREQLGSFIKQGEILTSLSDNSVMWVYFNVPEKEYLEYVSARRRDKQDPKVELVLANGNKFAQPGKVGVIEAEFNNKKGTIPFRADFSNPDGLLRHGQAGTIEVHRTLHDVTVIPTRAAYEFRRKWYVYIVDKDDVVHEREVVIQRELDDIFVIKNGVSPSERIVLEGIRQVCDGEKVVSEFRSPEVVLANRINLAE
jgi:membrane fusion protein (multidrug efflux system)